MKSNETAACYLDTFENPTLLFKAESGCEEGERSLMRQGGDLDQDLRIEGGFGRPASRHALDQRRLKRISSLREPAVPCMTDQV